MPVEIAMRSSLTKSPVASMSAPLSALLALVALLAVALLVGNGCAKKEPFVASPQALIGSPLPRVRIQRIDVGPTDLRAAEGKPTLLVLWASWCKPCAEEIPAVLRWHDERPDVQLLILNVDSTETDLSILRRLAGDWGIEAPLLATTPARAAALGLRSLPLSFVLDADGVVREAVEGFRGEEALLTWLNAQFPKP